MPSHRRGRLALLSLSLLLAGCLSAPPFVGSHAGPPTSGARVAIGRTVTFDRWDVSCAVRVDADGLTLIREDRQKRIAGLVPPEGLHVRWPLPASAGVEIGRGSGVPILWKNRHVRLAGRWYRLDRDDALEWDAEPAGVAGELGPYATFARGAVWMSTDATDLDLYFGRNSRVVERALAGDSVRFVVEDFELPRVRLTLGDGRDALWVGDDLWVDGQLWSPGR